MTFYEFQYSTKSVKDVCKEVGGDASCQIGTNRDNTLCRPLLVFVYYVGAME